MRKVNLNSRKIIKASQIIVIFAFFSGMWVNYIALAPVLDIGESLRLQKDIDNYCHRFCSDNFHDFKDSSLIDSLVSLDPYENGDLIIMNGNADIIYARNKINTSNVYEYIDSMYGDLGTNLLRTDKDSLDEISHMEYNQLSFISLYAHYEKSKDLLFFYAIDYIIAGKMLMDRIYFLIGYMLIGGLIVIFIGYIITKRITSQVHSDLKIQQELDTAALIQKSMLPKWENRLIQLDVDAQLIPAKKVGGDFFCYLLKDGLLYFCIGDVSGKSIPASLFMSKAVTIFRNCANSMMTLKEIATNLNGELCINNDLNMFITGIIGIMRIQEGEITYVNAGHEPPLIWDGQNSTNTQFLQSQGNIPFGIMSETEYLEETYQLKKNGLIILYTDGITEAKSKKNKLLGREKLLKLTENVKSMSSKGINDYLLNYISDFESGIKQSDDITILTFRNVTHPKKLVIENKISELKKIAPFIEEIFKECCIEKKEHILIRSGLDEALTNCVHYAYKTPGNKIEVTATIEDGKLCIVLKDSGIAFNPLEYNPEPSNELRVGGLGISIYKANFDDVQYYREDEYNILKLIKNI